MSETELKAMENEVMERIEHEFGCSRETSKFIVNMVASFHSARGGALYRISDYLDEHNIN